MNKHDSWRQALLDRRLEKDDFFRTGRHSPLTPLEREGFGGLNYFDPDPAWRVDAALQRVESADSIPLEVSTGGPPKSYVTVAQATFRAPGQKSPTTVDLLVDVHQVQAGAAAAHLFLPFRDATSGTQTYGAGRYLETPNLLESTSATQGVIDFNLAYAPFCAYSDAYVCPLPPRQNWLTFAVLAGERLLAQP